VILCESDSKSTDAQDGEMWRTVEEQLVMVLVKAGLQDEREAFQVREVEQLR
jgi:hypothetical protein